MKEFYYQIKGKRAKNDPERNHGLYGGIQNWVFPPLFSGKVEAENTDEAHKKIEALYHKKFPRRVSKKDLKSNEFLLHIEEIKEESHHVKRLFEVIECEQCRNKFRPIDKYNDNHCDDKGLSFCSNRCKQNNRQIAEYKRNEMINDGMAGTYSPIIYKITNKSNKKPYIGKTNQVFTLRWYQHFFQGGDTDFHKEIKTTKATDWIFEVIEIILIPENIKDPIEVEKLIREREQYYINLFDSINNGYNTLSSLNKKEIEVL